VRSLLPLELGISIGLAGGAFHILLLSRGRITVAHVLGQLKTKVGKNRKVKTVLMAGLTDEQKKAVRSSARRLLITAAAGSGKTETIARRVAWAVGVLDIPKDRIVAFTFTEKAADEMKFRIRLHLDSITPKGEDTTLGGMYVGTIHGFCIKMLRECLPDTYHNFDILDEAARIALVQRGYHSILGLIRFQSAFGCSGHFDAIDKFLRAYDILNEYGELDIELPKKAPPPNISPNEEADWVKHAALKNDIGTSDEALAFAESAARYYAFQRSRRFLDFSTSQSEFNRAFRKNKTFREALKNRFDFLVVDEVQDLNKVQYDIVNALVGKKARLTCVGDHRQAIYAWRGGRVDLMEQLYEELNDSADGEVLELTCNFRSTPRVIDVANRWAKTIRSGSGMTVADMRHKRSSRMDFHPSHVGVSAFDNRDKEARWIADSIIKLVDSDQSRGARHDTDDGSRGIAYSDIAVLVRSSTDARTYMKALETRDVPAIVRAGPDLFSQPEVQLFAAVQAIMVGDEEFIGGGYNSLPDRVRLTLGCDSSVRKVVREACKTLRQEGLSLTVGTAERLISAGELIHERITAGKIDDPRQARSLRNSHLKEFVRRKRKLRRVFPQTLFHFVLGEAGVGSWDQDGPRGVEALFHLGQLSSLITGMESPGWTSPGDFKYQVRALCLWGARNARPEEAPLLTRPDAVTISTVHAAKGLEYTVVFLADVNAQRFPSSRSRAQVLLPFDGSILRKIRPDLLSDNDNYDNERRLMYVALSRAERYLFVTCSGSRCSRFFKEVVDVIGNAGGITSNGGRSLLAQVAQRKTKFRRDIRLVTSFSDLRYYLECPYDFFMRKVLGFSPPIDQAFGYGRGVHNLMRAVHSEPKRWAELAVDSGALDAALEELIRDGLLYLRHTTGEPAENMRKRAMEIVVQYIRTYVDELDRLHFEPEREFETLIKDEEVAISGAIDLIRLDDPPRVTIIDFKSGEASVEAATRLDEEEMRLQVSLYGLAAKRELEYEPDRGLVRYLGEVDASKRELTVNLDHQSLNSALNKVKRMAMLIRRREFAYGPSDTRRCSNCDFTQFCARPENGMKC